MGPCAYNGEEKMKKMGIVLSVVAALGLIMGTAGEAFAKKAAKKNKTLWQGWAEEVSKAKLTWKAPAKGKKK